MLPTIAPACPESSGSTLRDVSRVANDADHSILGHIRESKEPEEFATCQECIRERQLPMRLVGVEHLFSGDKIIFYFLAENRVDPLPEQRRGPRSPRFRHHPRLGDQFGVHVASRKVVVG